MSMYTGAKTVVNVRTVYGVSKVLG